MDINTREIHTYRKEKQRTKREREREREKSAKYDNNPPKKIKMTTMMMIKTQLLIHKEKDKIVLVYL